MTPAAWSDEAVGPKVQYSAIRSGGGGLHTYVPEKWGVLYVEVTNQSHEPREVLSTTYFDSEPTLQYGRRVWVPGRSRLHTWYPVFIPRLSPDKGGKYDFHSLVLDGAEGSDQVTREESGQMLHSGRFPAQLEAPITGLIGGLGETVNGATNWPYEMVIAARTIQRLSRRVAHLQDRLFAPDEESLNVLDQVVIADDRVLDDAAGMAAVRRWVYGGGRLWVLLDRVDPQVMEFILGDEFVCQVVDRVGLTTIRIESTKLGQAAAVEIESEEPVDMARVVVEGVDVAYTVNGWPAAFWKSYGAGKVLATTLGPQGWVRPRAPGDERLFKSTTDALYQSPFVALRPMAELSSTLFQRQAARPPAAQAFEVEAGEYVGYSIPPRWLILGLLTVFAGTVLVVGLWLWRKSSLEHLGWVSPALALAIAAALLIVGGRNRHAIPPLAAIVELVEAIGGTDDVRTQGVVALYNPESTPGTIGARRGGRLVPDLAGLEGTTKRMVWTDLGSFNWEHLTLDGGQRLGRFEQSETLAERVEAHSSFGPDGLAGRLSAPQTGGLGDALVATREGRIGVEIGPDGRFFASARGTFGPDQYLSAGLLSDEQDRRRRVYAEVLPGMFGDEMSGRPLLFFWGERTAASFEFDAGRRRLGASLFAVPLVFERPQAETRFVIPAPLIGYRNARRPDGEPSSALWNHRTHEWEKRNQPAEAWLRFQLPRELLPVALAEARLVVQVTGPVGRFELAGLRVRERPADAARKEVVSLETWRDPVGTRTFEVTDRSVLAVDETGGLVLGILVGDPDRPELTVSHEADGSKVNYWRIEHLALELSGTIPPRGSAAAAAAGAE